MEAIIIALAPQLLTLLGAVFAGLGSWGIAILKSKVKIEAGKVALEQVDRVVGAVVGNLTQGVGAQIKEATVDGKLTSADKIRLKDAAVSNVKELLSKEVTKAASSAIDDLESYVSQKIEDTVRANKLLKLLP